ncbi:hypothetical protein IQ266_25610 [filamentous cyanobacterium LEGE 11480]|uniref:Uncharacterized protein n=1 Tax=Romeriopsis navalis LEGE 11480 TaxID=2777977 RepID=A0A928VVS5_9CYAN|nr:hypothetical protein [Romeriopsis navalis]MBE9033119.1 hypothetical protein [Romeriopsis navalis LEGE 11480]
MTYLFALPVVCLTVMLVAALNQLRKQQSKYKLLQQKWEETSQAIAKSHAEYSDLLTINHHQSQQMTALGQQVEQLQAVDVQRLQALDVAQQKSKDLYESIETAIAERTQSLELELQTVAAAHQRSAAVIQSLQEENQRLLEQMGMAQSRQPSQSIVQSSAITLEAQEKDFYQQERKRVVINVLTKELQGMPQGTRRQHIVADIVASNPVESERDEIARKIRSIFHDYQRMNAKIERTLESVGFKLIPGNNHYKMKFGGDDRYVFSFSKTPSDGRAGKNNASTICRKFL